MSKINNVYILGTKISILNYSVSLDAIHDHIKMKKSHYVCVAAVHLVMEAFKDKQLQRGINKSLCTTADGMPLAWLSHSSRVYGPDLMLALCEMAMQQRYRVFLLGGALAQGKLLSKVLVEKYPMLDICGNKDTPVRPIDAQENDRLITTLKTLKPHIVLVGLGCPLQEKWMIENFHKIPGCVCVGVGAAFDFISGREKQAPKWMQASGLEWFFRLMHHPKRLAYRYFVYNSWFLVLIVYSWFLHKIDRASYAP